MLTRYGFLRIQVMDGRQMVGYIAELVQILVLQRNSNLADLVSQQQNVRYFGVFRYLIYRHFYDFFKLVAEKSPLNRSYPPPFFAVRLTPVQKKVYQVH